MSNQYSKLLITLVFTLQTGLCFASDDATRFNDTLFSKQWGISNLGQNILRSSGELTRTQVNGKKGVDINWTNMDAFNIPEDREVVVAILDSGVDIHHPDLAGKIYFDKKLCPDGEDNSKKPCSGINMLESSKNLEDDTGHGTHVAGIIAANTNNQLGVAGVSDKRVKILPIKVLSKETNQFVYEGRAITDYFADAIKYAIDRGASVINMSIGWPKVVESPRMKMALKEAIDNDVAIIVAAGNNNKEIPTYPCTSENVICVGAIDNRGEITDFSNFGGKVDILAPGESIVSTYPISSVESRILRIRGYEDKKGTSQAAPYVTAIAANLKLLKPDMGLEELKARLFSTARPVVESNNNEKFSKFGLVDMKKALSFSPQNFIMPDYKNLLDVNFSNDGSFHFALPIKSLISDVENVKVIISTDHEAIELEKEIFELSLSKGRSRAVLVKGRLTDLDADASMKLNVRIEHEGDEPNMTKTTIFLSRNFERSQNDLIREEIKGFNAAELTFFRGHQKVSRINLIRQMTPSEEAAPAYYTLSPPSQSELKSVISLMNRKDRTWVRQDLSVEKLNEVVAVYSGDFDKDGSIDKLIYGVSKDQDYLIFEYIFSDEQQSHLRLKFDFLSLKGFPVSYEALADFSLIEVDYQNRKLLVPSFYTIYNTPEADNTLDLLDRIPEEIRLPHLFYLLPKSDKSLELRIVDSFSVMNRIRSDYGIESYLPVAIDAPFNQTQAQRAEGTLKGVLSVGEEFRRRYFLYEVKNKNLILSPINFPYRSIVGNSARSVYSLKANSLGERTSRVNFIAQLKRDQIRSYIWDADTGLGESQLVTTENWSDPIFNELGAYDDKKGSFFIETRYFVRAFDESGEVDAVRINRESSFPGVQFSETLSSVSVLKGERFLPGLFIDSTLIFGSRLYSVVKNEDKLVRPARLSIEVPEQCVHIKPQVIDNRYNYLMLCRESAGGISLKRYELAIGSN